MQDWFDSSISEALVAGVTALDQVVSSSAFDWFSEDGIGITVAENEDAAVSP